MKIAKNTVVSLSYTIRDEAGSVVDSSDGRRPLTYLHGHKQIVPGVEDAVEGRDPGAELEVSVDPSNGYGERDPDAMLILPRSAFPPEEDIVEGSVFRAFHNGSPVIFSVVSANSEIVVVDANHPLAGRKLRVNVEVLSVRKATNEEVEHRHAHEIRPSPQELA